MAMKIIPGKIERFKAEGNDIEFKHNKKTVSLRINGKFVSRTPTKAMALANMRFLIWG